MILKELLMVQLEQQLDLLMKIWTQKQLDHLKEAKFIIWRLLYASIH